MGCKQKLFAYSALDLHDPVELTPAVGGLILVSSKPGRRTEFYLPGR
ncbi:MAG: hypothetical protein R6U91_01430 [Bacillota bacterium]